MLSRDETKHIAGLARIGMSESDLDKFAEDLSVILDWVKQLEELETEKDERFFQRTRLEHALGFIPRILSD
jgi:aspartyl-tRNA(Asn)/glutamyl-tRNA(Gln) amidotransferase subunit C